MIGFKHKSDVTSNFLSKFANSMNLSLKPHKGSPYKEVQVGDCDFNTFVVIEDISFETCNDNSTPQNILPMGVPLSSWDRLARTSFAEIKKTRFFASNMSITCNSSTRNDIVLSSCCCRTWNMQIVCSNHKISSTAHNLPAWKIFDKQLHIYHCLGWRTHFFYTFRFRGGGIPSVIENKYVWFR